MKGIKRYIDKLKLNHITTGDILVEAMNKGLIDENIGNHIWANILSKHIKPTTALSAMRPARSFTAPTRGKSCGRKN